MATDRVRMGDEGAAGSLHLAPDSDLMCRFLPDTTLTFANDAYCRYFGRSRADLVGHSFLELIPAADREPARAHLASFTLDRPAAASEHQVTLPGGEVRWQQWTDHALFDASGRVTEFHSVGRDVTEQKRAERALRESEERYRALVTASADIVWRADPDGNALFVSPSWHSITGQPEGETGGPGWTAFVHPDDFPRVSSAWTEAAASRRAYESEIRIRGRDGTYRRYQVRGTPILAADGSIREWIGTTTDVHAAREAEAALRQGEERHRLATAAGGAGVFDLDLETGDMYVDPELKARLGYEDHEIPNRLEDWAKLADPTDLAAAQADLDAHVAGRTSQYENERRMRHRDGSVRWFLARGRVIRAPGEHARFVGTDTDITERKQAAEALRAVEVRNRAMLRAIPDLIFVLDRDGVYIDFHAPDPGLLAVPPEQLLGRRLRDIFPPELAGRFEQAVAGVVSSGEPVNVEYELAMGADVRCWEARIVPCDTGRVLSIVRDRTDQRRAERETRELREELAHVGRVTSLGALTGSLAHEINQPLAAIMANAQSAQRMLANGVADLAELEETLADIVADDRRAGEVLQRLRALLTKQAPQANLLDLRVVLEEMLALVHSDTVMRRIDLQVRLAPDRLPVRGDRVQLQQVALNLLLNAFEAVEGLEADRRKVVLDAARQDGLVTLSVVDEGPGIGAADLARIFEPFFTTKPAGMGLGLSICQTIASSHDGELVAARNAGGGMTFSLRLPAAADATPAASLPRRSRASLR